MWKSILASLSLLWERNGWRNFCSPFGGSNLKIPKWITETTIKYLWAGLLDLHLFRSQLLGWLWYWQPKYLTLHNILLDRSTFLSNRFSIKQPIFPFIFKLVENWPFKIGRVRKNQKNLKQNGLCSNDFFTFTSLLFLCQKFDSSLTTTSNQIRNLKEKG